MSANDLSHAETVFMAQPGDDGLPLYAGYFGLHQAPFSIAPDPRYLFMSERHREALAHLLYGVSGGGGFVVLTGEIGAGKTTVCRCFLEQIPRRCNVAYIFNPKLTVNELLHAVCTEFGVTCPPASESVSTKLYVDPLNEYLLRTHAVGQNNVLIIDEAQNLSAEVLEQLRLLTNLETAERKLLQIILIGQPELRDMLARPDMEQLAQRVIARYHLDALSASETRDYITHRLMVAGYRRETIFDDKAAQRVHQLSRGVPRRINLLCDRTLLGAYARNRATVDPRMVDTAAAEVFEPRARGSAAKVSHLNAPVPRAKSTSPLQRAAWLPWALGGGGVLAGALAAFAWTGFKPASPAVVAAAAPAPSAPRVTPPAQAASVVASVPASAPAASAPQAAPSAPVAASGAQAPLGGPGAWPTPGTGEPPALSAWAGETDAVRKLGQAWGQRWTSADPCTTEGPAQRVYCYRSPAGLSLLKQLDRPVVLTLRDATHPEAFVVLWGLDRDQVLIEGPKGLQTWPLAVVSARWRGDFVALWRAPEGYRSKILPGGKGPALDWLATRLSQVDQGAPIATPATLNTALTSRVLAFQVTQGLKADGVVGATTFMQLNRLTGENEPALLRRPASSAPAPSPARPAAPAAHVVHP
ncbi:MAG: hypothetical protein RI907_2801 [Pseudomonadota bacterium]|jgi:general secretion pathway protein A